MESLKEEESLQDKWAREKAEERKRKELARALVSKVCQVLGFTLEGERADDWNYLSVNARLGDESLHFASGSYYLRDRIKVSGNFPKTEKGESLDPYRYGEKEHEITVSVSKSPERIAKEIERRFLPRYREVLKSILEKVHKSNQYARTSERNLELVKGETLNDLERNNARFVLHLEPIFGEIKVSADEAAIELHCVPIEKARQIIRLIKTK